MCVNMMCTPYNACVEVRDNLRCWSSAPIILEIVFLFGDVGQGLTHVTLGILMSLPPISS